MKKIKPPGFETRAERARHAFRPMKSSLKHASFQCHWQSLSPNLASEILPWMTHTGFSMAVKCHSVGERDRPARRQGFLWHPSASSPQKMRTLCVQNEYTFSIVIFVLDWGTGKKPDQNQTVSRPKKGGRPKSTQNPPISHPEAAFSGNHWQKTFHNRTKPNATERFNLACLAYSAVSSTSPKSNKTERFHKSFDFDHVVPTTYDDALASRSIFGLGISDFVHHFAPHHFAIPTRTQPNATERFGPDDPENTCELSVNIVVLISSNHDEVNRRHRTNHGSSPISCALWISRPQQVVVFALHLRRGGVSWLRY
jgi:hypothetical protein